MKQTRVPAAAALALLLIAASHPWAANRARAAQPTEIPDRFCSRVAPAVVSLYAVGHHSQKATSRGTGFLLNENGLLLTARHVSEGDDELFAFTRDGKKYPVTGFYGEDRDFDIAVLKIQGEHLPHLALARAPLPATNQWVAVVSREADGSALCSTGVVAHVVGFPNVWELIRTTIPMHPGQSGSPLLNQKGEVVGVVSGTSREEYGTAMPVGIASQIIARTASRPPIPFARRPRKGSSQPLVLDPDFRAAFQSTNKNDLAECERRMKLLARKFPESPVPLALLGASYVGRESWKEADAACAKAIRLNPDFAFAWLMRGVSLTGRGRPAEAEAALRKSIELQLGAGDQLAVAWEMLGVACAEQGKINGIREAMDNLERLDAAKARTAYSELRHNFPRLDLPVERDRN